MKRQPVIPRAIDPYADWHDNLHTNVTAATPGADAADVTMLTADNADLHAKMLAAKNADTAARAAHAALNVTVKTTKTNASSLAGRITNNSGFTPTLAATLQLIGEENTVDPTVQQPYLKLTPKMNGMVEIGFDKMSGLFEGVHLYCLLEGQTAYTLLASETHSPYIDNRPLLVAGKPETRQYKAMYFIGKSEVGLLSDAATVTAAP
jgi:hypothetical protein